MPCGLNLEVGWLPVGRNVRRAELTEGVSAEDAVHLDVTLLPLLDEAQVRDVLREVLSESGWSRAADGTMSKTVGGAEATLSADGKTVTLRAAAAATVTVAGSVELEDPGGTDDDAREALAKREAKTIAARKAAERARLERQNLARLVRLEPELRGEVQTALNKTYRRALERRAREIGELESLRESGDAAGSYEVTITVRA